MKRIAKLLIAIGLFIAACVANLLSTNSAQAICTVEITNNCIDIVEDASACADTDCEPGYYSPFYYCPEDTVEHEVNDRDFTTTEERDYDGGPEINWGDDYAPVPGTTTWCDRWWDCDYSSRCTAATNYKCQVDFGSGAHFLSQVQDHTVIGRCPDDQ